MRFADFAIFIAGGVRGPALLLCPAHCLQDLADFSAEIAAFHGNQTPIAAEAAARELQQAEEATTARAAVQAASEHVSADTEGEAACVGLRHRS